DSVARTAERYSSADHYERSADDRETVTTDPATTVLRPALWWSARAVACHLQQPPSPTPDGCAGPRGHETSQRRPAQRAQWPQACRPPAQPTRRRESRRRSPCSTSP